jgi:hypothetical protein
MLAASIIRAMVTLTMEAASTCETPVNFYQTTRNNISEDSHIHARRRENLKSHLCLSPLGFISCMYLDIM